MPGMLVPVAVMAATGSPVGLIVGGAAKLKGETGSETSEGAATRTAKEVGNELQVAFDRQGWTQVAATNTAPANSAPDQPVTTAEPTQPATQGISQTAAVPAASEDSFALQLASFKNAEAAQQEWMEIQGKFPKLLEDTTAIVQPASVDGVGKVYRLKAGPFPTHATAADVCAQLMAAQQDCLVVKR
jgi:cell division septation protein DedD